MARVRQARRCRARRSDGNPCGAYSIVGGVVCTAHGGGSPRVRRKANMRVLEASMLREFAIRRRRWNDLRVDWLTRRAIFAARVLDLDPVEVVRIYGRGGWVLLPPGVDWPPGLGPDDMPQLTDVPCDRRFGPRWTRQRSTSEVAP